MKKNRNKMIILIILFSINIVTIPIRILGLLVGVIIWQPLKDGFEASDAIEKWRTSDDQ